MKNLLRFKWNTLLFVLIVAGSQIGSNAYAQTTLIPDDSVFRDGIH